MIIIDKCTCGWNILTMENIKEGIILHALQLQ